VKRSVLAGCKVRSKRTALKAVIDDASKSDEERYALVSNCNNCPALNLLASVTAARSRSSAWYVPQFGLARSKIREIAFRGESLPDQGEL